MRFFHGKIRNVVTMEHIGLSEEETKDLISYVDKLINRLPKYNTLLIEALKATHATEDIEERVERLDRTVFKNNVLFIVRFYQSFNGLTNDFNRIYRLSDWIMGGMDARSRHSMIEGTFKNVTREMLIAEITKAIETLEFYVKPVTNEKIEFQFFTETKEDAEKFLQDISQRIPYVKMNMTTTSESEEAERV